MECRAGQDHKNRKESSAEQRIEYRLRQLTELLEQAEEGGKHPVIIAIDGRSASGKTTLSGLLQSRLGAGVIHMDDFFLPPFLRTKERYGLPGGNVHYERFLEEVIPCLKKGEEFSYVRFDCHQMAMGETVRVPQAEIYVVEGAYSTHPKLGDYMDIRVFSDIAREEQAQRLKEREKDRYVNFAEKWIPLEEAYFQEYGIKEAADLVI